MGFRFVYFSGICYAAIKQQARKSFDRNAHYLRVPEKFDRKLNPVCAPHGALCSVSRRRFVKLLA